MKINQLFIPASIFCTILIGCNPPAKQESATSNNDDIVWKANLSYCLTNDKLDWQGVRDGYTMDFCEIYNFKVSDEKGDFKKLMKLFYDSASSKTYPFYWGDPVSGLCPVSKFSQKDKHEMFPDSIWNNEHTKLLSVGSYFQNIKALSFNHEWLFDSKAGKLISNITDVNLLATNIPPIDLLFSIGVLKFSDRINDSSGTDHLGFKPEIMWGHELLMPIVDSGNGLEMMNNEHWIKMDSLSRHTLNGKPYISSDKYPVVIKTMFDKTLAEWVLIAARSGKLQAYKYIGEDKIGDSIPAKDVKTLCTIVNIYPDEHGIKKGYPHRIDGNDLSGVEIKEEITFHKSTFSFESKISYAGVLLNVTDTNTHKPIRNSSTTLFWVKLN